MITKEVSLAGKNITLAYCYGTEIAYKKFTGDDADDFFMQAIPAIQNEKMPDIEKLVYMILSCIVAYYEQESDYPVTDREIMQNVTPQELGFVLGTIIALRAEFYYVPSGEPEDKQRQSEGEEKKE